MCRKILQLTVLVVMIGMIPARAEDILATIADQTVTQEDLLSLVRKVPTLRVYLGVPGGPEQLLHMVIREKLLTLEGERRDIPRPEISPDNDSIYAVHVEQQLLEPCQVPDDEQVLMDFYNENPNLFSTPLMIRMSRIGVSAGSEDDRRMAEQYLGELRRKIESDDLAFVDAINQFDQRLPLVEGSGGDLGFIRIEQPRNPLWQPFADAAIGSLIGPIQETGYVALYQVTDRREPILAEFESIQAQLPEDYLRHCREQRRQALLQELQTRWPVDIKVSELKTLFEAD